MVSRKGQNHHKGVEVVAEEGKKMKTKGVVVVDIVIYINIAQIRDDDLLGCDIIDEFDIAINMRRVIKIGVHESIVEFNAGMIFSE